jgi:hypothetical protein
MLIVGLVLAPFWLAFWWAIGGNNMEQETENIEIARISQPFVADFSLYHGSPRGKPGYDPFVPFADQHPSPCDSQPRLVALGGGDPMYRSYMRAKYNMENLCRFVSMTNPNPDLSAAPLVTLRGYAIPATCRNGVKVKLFSHASCKPSRFSPCVRS